LNSIFDNSDIFLSIVLVDVYPNIYIEKMMYYCIFELLEKMSSKFVE